MDKVVHIGYNDRWRQFWGCQSLMRRQKKWRTKASVQGMLIKTKVYEANASAC